MHWPYLYPYPFACILNPKPNLQAAVVAARIAGTDDATEQATTEGRAEHENLYMADSQTPDLAGTVTSTPPLSHTDMQQSPAVATPVDDRLGVGSQLSRVEKKESKRAGATVSLEFD